MALIKPSPLVNDIRGSVGGVTFGRNSAGMFARAKVTPVNPDSPAQVNIRGLFTVAAIGWRSVLDGAQRNAWNLLGTTTTFKNALGDDYNPSGIQLYIRSTVLLALSNQTAVSLPPPTAIVPVGIFTVAWTTTVGIEITAFDPGNADFPSLITQTSGPLSGGISFFKGPFRISAIFDDTETQGTPLLVKASSLLLANSRYFVRFRAIFNNGSASTDAIFTIFTGPIP